jgi:hypothetical protein
MAGISQINYADALAGRIAKRPLNTSMGAWFEARGATLKGSNAFVDATLRLGDDHLDNILMIIRSARKQGHNGVEIRLTPESLSDVSTRIAEISALEDADIEARFYGEYRNKEQVVVTFRTGQADWLLELAKQELSEDEYTELSQLITTRLTRSKRETLLTEKAIAARRARDCR